MAGWGQKIEELLVGPVEVANYARSAMTTRKYYTERFYALLNRMVRGDVVILGFGGVDHMIHNGMRYVPVPEYQELLRLFVQYIREEGGIPVFASPVSRYAFTPSGEVVNTRGDYPAAMAAVAAEMAVPFIDLFGQTTELWARLGPSRLRQYFCWVDAGEHPLHPDGNIDSSHLNHPGAYEVARMVVTGLVHNQVLAKEEVDVPRLMEPTAMPPVSQEFLIQSPEAALHYAQRSGAAPGIAKPGNGWLVGPMSKFSGMAAPGTDYLLFFEHGQYIGGARVGAGGQWIWRRSVNWTAGEHVVQCVGLRGDGCTPVSEVSFSVMTEVPAPTITAPKEGGFSGPKVRFGGKAAKGVKKIVLMERGTLIGATSVDENGEWSFTHNHQWKAGRFQVQAIALFGALESPAAVRDFKVVGLPDHSPLRVAGASRHDCAEQVCPHRPFLGSW